MAGMRSLQTLDISLGLFGFSTKVYKSIDDPADAVSFKQLHSTCREPITQVKRCNKCNVDVPYGDILKGYPTGPNTYLAFTEAEVKAIKPAAEGVIKIDGYVGADDIDTAFLSGVMYYLAPNDKMATTFATFRDALNGRWALGKVVMYGREYVAAIRAVERILAMHFLRSTAEIRNPANVPAYDKIPEFATDEHIELMSQLIDNSLVNISDVMLESDTYADAVRSLVKARMDGMPDPMPAAAPSLPNTPDLMKMLKASLDKKKKEAVA